MRKHSQHIPYTTIAAAKGGDADAIQTILRHYERYILHYCRRTVYDEDNIPHIVIDEDARSRIEAGYLEAFLLHYDICRLPPGERLETD